jgi:hypothetical protein
MVHKKFEDIAFRRPATCKLLVTQKFAGIAMRESLERNANFWKHRTTAKFDISKLLVTQKFAGAVMRESPE